MTFRILLVIPSQEKVYGMKMVPSYPPLGVLYLAGVLEKIGSSVKILDMDADKINYKRLLSFIKDFKPNMVGLTATTPVIKEAFKLASFIKEHFEIPVILGGIHATMNAEECIKYPSIDFIAKGESEETVKELALEMMDGKCDFGKVRGLYHKKNGNYYFGGERDLIDDLDRIPNPAWRLVGNLFNYKPPDAEHLPVVSIMTTRGCPGKCTYCCTKNIFKDRYRMRSIDNVIGEIDELIGRFKAKEIHIADDAFNVNKERVLKLSEAIRKRKYSINFEFLNGLRADVIDDEMLDAFKSIGVKNVGFGVETTDLAVLRDVKKNIVPEKVEKSVKLAKKNGFKTWVFFMLGLPGETEATIKKNIEFAKKVDPDFAKFLIFKPFPGSEIYYEINKKGLIDDFDFDNYGIYTPPVHRLQDLTKADLLYWQKRAFREFYFRPKKIWDHIKRQKSLSQLKLTLRGLSFVCFNAFKKGK